MLALQPSTSAVARRVEPPRYRCHLSPHPTSQRLSRPVLTSTPAIMPSFLKRGLSMICTMVHGSNEPQPQPPSTQEPQQAAATSMEQQWLAQAEAARVQALADAAELQDAASEPAAEAAPATQQAQAAEAEEDPYAKQAKLNQKGKAYIKVVGCGGGGGNAIARMIQAQLQHVEFWAVNTDKQALDVNICPNKLQIGTELTRGLGTGGKPSLGEQAALESIDDLQDIVAGADMIFITAGMGGGTGTGAAPVIAQLAKEQGILTVGVVTHPFTFEGRRRATQAVQGIDALKQHVDTLIVILNDDLLKYVDGTNTPLSEAFQVADSVLQQGVSGISETIMSAGRINVDFADIKAIMTNSGTAMLGVGRGSGPDRAEQAALDAINAPLTHGNLIESATGMIYNISSCGNVTLAEVARISDIITPLADASCHIIVGEATDETLAPDELHVTLIATGFSRDMQERLLNGRVISAPQQQQQKRMPLGASQASNAGSTRQQLRSPSPMSKLPNRGAPTFNGRNWLQ